MQIECTIARWKRSRCAKIKIIVSCQQQTTWVLLKRGTAACASTPYELIFREMGHLALTKAADTHGSSGEERGGPDTPQQLKQ